MKDCQFMTAKEKDLVLKQWETFLKSGLKPEKFTPRLYHHLTLHCEFIAHYSREGFFHTYFVEGGDIAHFLSQFDSRTSCESIEYGSNRWLGGDYNDINQAMIDAASKYIPALVDHAQNQQKQADIQMASQLLSKHGISLAQS